jgi:hypothetical protein
VQNIPEIGKGSFFVLNEENSEDCAKWRELVENFADCEPMMLPEYLRLFSVEPSEKVLCAWYMKKKGGVIYPFILRRIDALGWCPKSLSGFSDVTTPYGYGGPFHYGEMSESEIRAFWAYMDDWYKENGVITEFIRFSLELSRPRMFYPGEAIIKNKNIVRTLYNDMDEIWLDFEYKVRKNVRKAERNGLCVELDTAGSRIDDFLRIYYSTMARRGAKPFYHFNSSFFDELNRALLGKFAYFHTIQNNTIISSELVLYSRTAIYSFLGGTERSSYDLRPNDLLKYEIIKWGAGSGRRWFVIGGGYQPEDGIYKYKKSFAPQGDACFYTGQRILNLVAFDDINNARREYELETRGQWTPLEGYFPQYRS